MEYLNFIVPACWIIFLVYWIISARKTKRTIKTKGPVDVNFYPIMFLGYILFVRPRFPKPFDFLSVKLLPDNQWLMLLGIAIVIGGLVITIIARRTLADNWSSAVTFKENHELITAGIYHFVRHPIYTGILLMFLGSAYLYLSWSTIIGFGLMVFAIIYKIRLEEKMMTEHFPDAYPIYKTKVKAIIPFVL